MIQIDAVNGRHGLELGHQEFWWMYVVMDGWYQQRMRWSFTVGEFGLLLGFATALYVCHRGR